MDPSHFYSTQFNEFIETVKRGPEAAGVQTSAGPSHPQYRRCPCPCKAIFPSDSALTSHLRDLLARTGLLDNYQPDQQNESFARQSTSASHHQVQQDTVKQMQRPTKTSERQNDRSTSELQFTKKLNELNADFLKQQTNTTKPSQPETNIKHPVSLNNPPESQHLLKPNKIMGRNENNQETKLTKQYINDTQNTKTNIAADSGTNNYLLECTLCGEQVDRAETAKHKKEKHENELKKSRNEQKKKTLSDQNRNNEAPRVFDEYIFCNICQSNVKKSEACTHATEHLKEPPTACQQNAPPTTTLSNDDEYVLCEICSTVFTISEAHIHAKEHPCFTTTYFKRIYIQRGNQETNVNHKETQETSGEIAADSSLHRVLTSQNKREPDRQTSQLYESNTTQNKSIHSAQYKEQQQNTLDKNRIHPEEYTNKDEVSNRNENYNKRHLSEDASTDDDDHIEEYSKQTKKKSKKRKRKQKQRRNSNNSSDGISSNFDSSDSESSDTKPLLKLIKLLTQKPDSLKAIQKSLKYVKQKKQQKLKSIQKMKLCKCKHCSMVFLNQSKLRKHLKNNRHDIEKKRCKYCKLKFSTKTMKKHMQKHHKLYQLRLEDFKITSDLSSSSPSTSESESGDMDYIVSDSKASNSHRQPKATTCEKKEELHSTGDNKIKHHHNKQSKDHCLTEETLKINGHLDKVYQCNKCDICFLQWRTLRNHLYENMHNILTKTKCSQCDLNFTKKSLYKHIKYQHLTQNSKTLKIVNVNRTGSYNLSYYNISKNSKEPKDKLHVISPHKTIKQGYSNILFKCRICNTCFLTLSAMESHLFRNRHDSQKQRCPTCNLMFTNLTMEKHTYIHHNIYKLKDKKDFRFIVLPPRKDFSPRTSEIHSESETKKEHLHKTTRHFNKNKETKQKLEKRQKSFTSKEGKTTISNFTVTGASKVDPGEIEPCEPEESAKKGECEIVDKDRTHFCVNKRTINNGVSIYEVSQQATKSTNEDITLNANADAEMTTDDNQKYSEMTMNKNESHVNDDANKMDSIVCDTNSQPDNDTQRKKSVTILSDVMLKMPTNIRQEKETEKINADVANNGTSDISDTSLESQLRRIFNDESEIQSNAEITALSEVKNNYLADVERVSNNSDKVEDSVEVLDAQLVKTSGNFTVAEDILNEFNDHHINDIRASKESPQEIANNSIAKDFRNAVEFLDKKISLLIAKSDQTLHDKASNLITQGFELLNELSKDITDSSALNKSHCTNVTTKLTSKEPDMSKESCCRDLNEKIPKERAEDCERITNEINADENKSDPKGIKNLPSSSDSESSKLDKIVAKDMEYNDFDITKTVTEICKSYNDANKNQQERRTLPAPEQKAASIPHTVIPTTSNEIPAMDRMLYISDDEDIHDSNIIIELSDDDEDSYRINIINRPPITIKLLSAKTTDIIPKTEPLTTDDDPVVISDTEE